MIVYFNRIITYSTLILIFIFLQFSHASLYPSQGKNSAEILLALKKINVLGSALYIAAHPDDENTEVLAYLANERMVRTAYLSLTRGGGGQNLMGTEKGELLGMLRTQELLAARRIDGAEQFFTRAIDFGYSKSPEESLKIWGKKELLADVVWIIRTFRPDIILTRFTPERGGHGHHLASAILAEEAFYAAADPHRFPEQLQHVDIWQAKRLVWDVFTSDANPPNEDHSNRVRANIGKWNPLLGKSYSEIAAESRSMHKCQGFGATPVRGNQFASFQHVLGTPAEKDLFDAIDMSWGRVPGGVKVDRTIRSAIESFDFTNPARSIPLLVTAYRQLRELPIMPWKTQKQKELLQLLSDCAGLWVEAISKSYKVTPGESFDLTAKMINRSHVPMTLNSVAIPAYDVTIDVHQALDFNHPVAVHTEVSIPSGTKISQPPWLWFKASEGLYHVDTPLHHSLRNDRKLPLAVFGIQMEGQSFPIKTPILFRWTDPVRGEQFRALEIHPPIVVSVDEELCLFPTTEPREIHVTVTSNQEKFRGNLCVQIPENWAVDQEKIPVNLEKIGDKLVASITITPPPTASIGNLRFKIEDDEKRSVYSHKSIAYPHIPIQNYFPLAQSRLVRLNLRTSNAKIGYIMGSGDEIPHVLRQLGFRVKILTDEDIREKDFNAFDVMITGIRAYNTRSVLQNAITRLLDFVEAGGILIDQYNKVQGLLVSQLGPFPFSLSKDRVTLENAPVKILHPNHRFFHFPNKITNADFDGWVQERGTYFPNKWHPKYTPLLSCHDPGDSPKEGGMILAKYGKGFYVYSGYSWFRQLPAGIPGAIRLFVNLLSVHDSRESSKKRP